jgi:Ca2+-binding RTX toxin-like protein
MAKKPKSTDIPANSNTKAVLEGFGASIGSYSGQLEFAGDHDWIKVDLAAGTTYDFYLSFLETGSLLTGKSTLVLHNPDGSIASSDSSPGVGDNLLLSFPAVTGGTYFIEVGALGDNATGTYSLFSIGSGASTATDAPFTINNDDVTGAADTRILGGTGAAVIDMAFALDALGEQGNDRIDGNGLNNHISGGLGNDTIAAGAGNDIVFGDAGNDDIFAGIGGDTIFGGLGDDILNGQAGTDELYGGLGKDFLTGGTEDDYFYFRALADSKKGAARDVILDFSSSDSDRIVLSDIDAKRGGADNAFKFIGKQGFHDKAGELHFVNKGGYLLVEGDVNGDGRADFQIEVHGVTALTAGDFAL